MGILGRISWRCFTEDSTIMRDDDIAIERAADDPDSRRRMIAELTQQSVATRKNFRPVVPSPPQVLWLGPEARFNLPRSVIIGYHRYRLKGIWEMPVYTAANGPSGSIHLWNVDLLDNARHQIL